MRTGKAVEIQVNKEAVHGDLILVPGSKGIVLFAYGSGSSRFSQRERFVSEKLNDAGISTLFIDLLTEEEEKIDEMTREYRFNIPLLADRLDAAVHWERKNKDTKHMKVGLFGGSTGASACLIASAKHPGEVSAVVSRGGRTDLADEQLPRIKAPTLFIVGGDDLEVLNLNEMSLKLLKCEKKLEIVPNATHLFEEPGKLDEVAKLSIKWFKEHLK